MSCKIAQNTLTVNVALEKKTPVWWITPCRFQQVGDPCRRYVFRTFQQNSSTVETPSVNFMLSEAFNTRFFFFCWLQCCTWASDGTFIKTIGWKFVCVCVSERLCRYWTQILHQVSTHTHTEDYLRVCRRAEQCDCVQCEALMVCGKAKAKADEICVVVMNVVRWGNGE